MDELNQKALDQSGELALEEAGDEIIVFRGALAQVVGAINSEWRS